MARIAVDAATLVHLVTEDITIDPGHVLVGGNAIRSQALQLLLDDVRAGARTQDDALALHERLTRTRMRLLGDRVSRAHAWRLALEHGWSIAQAEGVALALLQADGFVTVDATLAAQASTVATVLPVEALRRG